MAGLNLRLNKSFVTGDHIRVGDHAGRVAERDLFDTDIRTANRELVSLPNVQHRDLGRPDRGHQ